MRMKNIHDYVQETVSAFIKDYRVDTEVIRIRELLVSISTGVTAKLHADCGYIFQPFTYANEDEYGYFCCLVINDVPSGSHYITFLTSGQGDITVVIKFADIFETITITIVNQTHEGGQIAVPKAIRDISARFPQTHPDIVKPLKITDLARNHLVDAPRVLTYAKAEKIEASAYYAVHTTEGEVVYGVGDTDNLSTAVPGSLVSITGARVTVLNKNLYN